MSEKADNIIKAICLVVIIVTVIAFLFVYYSHKNEPFVYEEHLEEKVFTISEGKQSKYTMTIDLQEMTYYVINVEGDIHEMAIQYNSDNPDAYWRVKRKGTYTMRQYAKELAFDSCVRDNIYYIEALKAGVELTEEERMMAKKDAKTILENASAKWLQVSDFTIDVLYYIEEKLYIASKYVNKLSENGYTNEELELKGTYYEKLREQYSISVNEKLWDKVKFGNITLDK